MSETDAAIRMDRIYRYQRFFYDATRRYYLLGRETLIENLAPPAGGSVLEIGCGTGRNLVKIAERYPEIRLYGVDVSREMLATARASITRQGLDKRIVLIEGDAGKLDAARTFGGMRFDRICFSYVLSMVPDWPGALARAADLIAPSGEIHIADFGRGSDLPRVAKRALFWWLRTFHVNPIEDLDRRLQVFAAERGIACLFSCLHNTYTAHAILRHTRHQVGRPIDASGTGAARYPRIPSACM